MAAGSTDFGISTFLGAFEKGGALASLFKVQISNYPSVGPKDLGNFSLLCKAASFPTSAVDTTEVTYMGRPFKIPMNRASQDWITNVYNDEDFIIRQKIEQWMQVINTHKGNIRMSGALAIDSYTGTLEVEQYSKEGKGTGNKYKFLQAFPHTLAEITMAWETNEIETYDITWAYAHWESNKITL